MHQITALHCRWQASEVQGSEEECPACSYRIAEGGYWLARPVNFYALVSFPSGIWQGGAPLPAGIWQGGAPLPGGIWQGAAPLPGDCIGAPSCWRNSCPSTIIVTEEFFPFPNLPYSKGNPTFESYVEGKFR